MTKGMKVSELLFIGSGLEDSTHFNKLFFGRADLIRVKSNLRGKSLIKLNLKKLLELGENDLELKKGDRLIVYSKEIYKSFSKSVNIEGVIENPGTYELYDDMSLGDLILQAGGISKTIRYINIEIANANDAIFNSARGPIVVANVDAFAVENNKNLYFGNSNEKIFNYILKQNDNVSIFSSEIIGLRKVTLQGEILYPGSYVLKTDEDNLYDLILRAGGLTKNANEEAGYVIRDGLTIKSNFGKIVNNKRSKYNMSLTDGIL